MRTYQVKKVFRGCVSVRDYIVAEALKAQEDLMIIFNDESMVIPWQKLHEGKESHLRIPSKHGAITYDLIDFNWVPDDSQKRLFQK